MSFSCTSPTSTSEEDWINEVLSFSPLDLTTSNDVNSQLASPTFGPDSGTEIAPDYEDLFSPQSSGHTSATTPGATSQTQETQETQKPSEKESSAKSSDHKLLDNVSYKLHQLKEQNCLTPKALESLFNTQDVLADSGDWQGDTRHKHRRSKANSLAEPSVKQCCHQRQKAMHSQCHRKRKNSRGKAPKPAHPHPQTHTSPRGSRQASVAGSGYASPQLGPVCRTVSNSANDTPCFPESWYATPSMPGYASDIETSECEPFLGDFAPLDTTACAVSPIAEDPNAFFASAGPMQQSPVEMAPRPDARFDAALDEAMAYIDFLQDGNVFPPASLEQVI
ncbi:hypothetical protein OXX79_000899 [Metschnikowia pulcherrima]